MNARALLLKTADHIEQNPSSYKFTEVKLPTGRRQSACLIGWMAHYAGHWSWFGAALSSSERCESLIGVSSGEFFGRLDEIGGWWTHEASVAAWALREYANRYHPEDAYVKFRNGLNLEPRDDEHKATQVQALYVTEGQRNGADVRGVHR